MAKKSRRIHDNKSLEAVKRIIEVNKQLKTSIDSSKESLDAMNEAYKEAVKNSLAYEKIVEKINKNINKKMFTQLPVEAKEQSIHNTPNTPRTPDKPKDVKKETRQTKDNMDKFLTNRASGMIGGALGKVSGSKALGGAFSTLMNRTLSSMKLLDGAKMSSGLLKTSLGVLGLTAAFIGMNKAGEEGYKRQVDMSNSLRQLGDGANYALGYSKKLNDELGRSMADTLNGLAKMATGFQSMGYNGKASAQASSAINEMGTRIALNIGVSDPEGVKQVINDVYDTVQNGSDAAAKYGLQAGESVMAGWLSAKHGVNMYAVSVSEAQMANYRLAKLEQETTKMYSNSADVKNSAAAKQLRTQYMLAEMGAKLQAIFVPVYQLFVEIGYELTNVIFGAVNSILKLMGKEQLTVAKDIKGVNQNMVNSIQNQNAAYTKQGEILEKNKGSLYGWDELNNMNNALLQLDNSALEGDLKDLGINDDNVDMNLKPTIDDSDVPDYLKNDDEKEIKARIAVADDEELKEMWDKMDLLQKGENGMEVAVRFMQLGDLPKALEALLYGSIADFLGLTTIKDFIKLINSKNTWEFMENGLSLLTDGSKTLLFLFGGWKGKIAAAAGELTEFAWGGGGLGKVMGMVSSMLVMFGGWKGAIAAAFITLIPFAAKLGEMLGKLANSKLNDMFGSQGVWGDLQSWDARTAANMQYGEGTEAAKQQYYKNMNEKFKGKDIKNYEGTGTINSGKANDLAPKFEQRIAGEYAQGGGFSNPTIGLIGEGAYNEIVQPVDGPIGEGFKNDIASKVVNSLGDSGTGDNLVINNTIGQGGIIIASRQQLKELWGELAPFMYEDLKNRGVATRGSR